MSQRITLHFCTLELQELTILGAYKLRLDLYECKETEEWCGQRASMSTMIKSCKTLRMQHPIIIPGLCLRAWDRPHGRPSVVRSVVVFPPFEFIDCSDADFVWFWLPTFGRLLRRLLPSRSLSFSRSRKLMRALGQKIPGQRAREAGGKGRSRKRKGDRDIGWTQEEQRGGR